MSRNGETGRYAGAVEGNEKHPQKSCVPLYQVFATLQRFKLNGSHYQYVVGKFAHDEDPPFEIDPYIPERDDIGDWEDEEYADFVACIKEGFLHEEVRELARWLVENYGSNLDMITVVPLQVSRLSSSQYIPGNLTEPHEIAMGTFKPQPIRVKLHIHTDLGFKIEPGADLIDITGYTDLGVPEGLFKAYADIRRFEFDSNLYKDVRWWLFRPEEPPFDPEVFLPEQMDDFDEFEQRLLVEGISNSYNLDEICTLTSWFLQRYGEHVSTFHIRPARTMYELQPTGAYSVGGWDDFLMLTKEPGCNLPFKAWAYFDILDEELLEDHELLEVEAEEILSPTTDGLYSKKSEKALRKKFGDELIDSGVIGGKTTLNPEFGMFIRQMPEN